jgi:hypothetical protein
LLVDFSSEVLITIITHTGIISIFQKDYSQTYNTINKKIQDSIVDATNFKNEIAIERYCEFY